MGSTMAFGDVVRKPPPVCADGSITKPPRRLGSFFQHHTIAELAGSASPEI
jgi:hypothetical protein